MLTGVRPSCPRQKALKKSTIRKTSQEEDAKTLADTFAKQTNTALETFKHLQKADPEVNALVHTAAQIDPLVYSLQLTPQTTSQWETAARPAGVPPRPRRRPSGDGRY